MQIDGSVYDEISHARLFEVINHLEQHPEHAGLSARKLADVVGVSHTWCNKAKKYIYNKKINVA